MATRIIEFSADVPAGPGGQPPGQQITTAFDTANAAAASDMGNTLLGVITEHGLASGQYVTITARVVDVAD